MADKHTLRSLYLEKRLILSQEEFERRNVELANRTLEFLGDHSFGHIHIFLSIDEKREVDTKSVIDKYRNISPLSRFYVSKTLPNGQLEHYELNHSTELKKNKWGIPEPVSAQPVTIDHVDLIFVPLIIYDKVGHRIGYGKGYYDRFLKGLPNAMKVGLSISPPLDVIPYVEETDVTINRCITPYLNYQFD